MTTLTATGVKPIPTYVPPADGKPRNEADAKWMRLHRAMLNRPVRLAKKTENLANSDRH